MLEIRLRGDGQQPRGTVSASVNARKQATRTLKVGVVLVNGKWLVDTIDGRPAAKAIASFSQ